MPVFHLNDLPKDKRIQMIGEFYDTIDSLKGRTEIRSFFKSLLTADEIATLMRRIEIAVLLSANFSYDKIIAILGVGSNKITSVHKCLQQDDSGYKIIVDRLIENRKKRLRKIIKEEKDAKSSLTGYKKTHPGHFLLPNLVDAAIERLEENDEELKKEALLFTPSAEHPKHPRTNA
ncbi:MAG: YerC/YecD family TrpR-related protein [Candidatus Staskawiczbacteria bacterium]|nr:YerC/YecD family TrpR-related protein [Candidatus Staskawiczbacteria bacterium]